MIISKNKKNFTCYIKKLFILINHILIFLCFIFDSLTISQQMEKENERSKLEFFFYKTDNSYMLDYTLVKNVYWDQIYLIIKYIKLQAVLYKIKINIKEKK